MVKFFSYHFATFVILSLILVSYPSRAAVEDEFVELTEKAQDIKAKETRFKGTWLTVPIPISNPTVGSGLQAAILYLHPKESENPEVPNSTSGIAGMYTDSESWFAGGFHDGSWKEGKIRYRAGIVTAGLKLDYYAPGIKEDASVPYTINTDAVLGQMLGRLPNTKNWYMGLRYAYSSSDLTFKISNAVDIPAITGTLVTSSLGLMTNYDSRNNNYYPTSGQYFEAVFSRDDESWGSDFSFDKLTSFYNYYVPLSNKSTLALQARYASASGDTPFYLLPFLQMRGFPAGKYKDDFAMTGHFEWRYKFHPRWGFVTFYELGSAENTFDDLFKNDIITSYGGGIRWQVSEDKKLNLGVDVAVSNDDYTLYVKIGEQY